MFEIGYTTGVFDLFHAGHMAYLKQVKSYCNFLVVGICSDDLVIQLKNRKPIFSEKNRMEIISGIKVVDYSFIKHTTDKLQDWHKYHFNAVFHGDQEAKNRFHEIENRKRLEPYGVKFIYFDRDYKLSTTKYIDYIRKETR